jgi:hypothetical protein
MRKEAAQSKLISTGKLAHEMVVVTGPGDIGFEAA